MRMYRALCFTIYREPRCMQESAKASVMCAVLKEWLTSRTTPGEHAKEHGSE